MTLERSFFENLFKDLVERSDVTKLPRYFDSEATVNLNGKEMTYAEFEKRIQWMSKRKMKVTFVDCLFDTHQAFCKHFSEIEENGATSTFKVLSHSLLKDGRVVRFEHITLKVEGEASDSVVNAF